MQTTKRRNRNFMVIIIACVTVFVVAGVVLGLGDFHSNKKTNVESTKATTETTIAEKTTRSETETKETIEFPDEMKTLLEGSSITPDVLNNALCQQLIVVNGNGTSGQIAFFENEDGQWRKKDGTTASAYLGRNGVTQNKTEGDGCTPLGFYKIGSAFYKEQRPETKLKTFQINEESYWVDDSKSVFYNQYVEGTEQKDWESAERMIEYNGYKYGFVVDYNPTCEPGKGSAIFFHVGYNPTAGCIATNEATILKYLSVLDPQKNPYVVIV